MRILNESPSKFVEERHVGRNPTSVAKALTRLNCLSPMPCGGRETVFEIFAQRTSGSIGQSLQFRLRGLPTFRSALIGSTCWDARPFGQQLCNLLDNQKVTALLHSKPAFDAGEKLPSQSRCHFIEEALRTAVLAVWHPEADSADIVHELVEKVVMDEGDGDAPNLNIDARLLGEKVPDVPKLRRRQYVAANIQPHSGLSVGFARSIDEEIKFPNVDTSADFDFFAVVDVWMVFQLANGHADR